MCYACGNKDLIGSDADAIVQTKSFIPTIIKANEASKNVGYVLKTSESLSTTLF